MHRARSASSASFPSVSRLLFPLPPSSSPVAPAVVRARCFVVFSCRTHVLLVSYRAPPRSRTARWSGRIDTRDGRRIALMRHKCLRYVSLDNVRYRRSLSRVPCSFAGSGCASAGRTARGSLDANRRISRDRAETEPSRVSCCSRMLRSFNDHRDAEIRQVKAQGFL